jgi:coenzyme PQQ precursor peptide PqqA
VRGTRNSHWQTVQEEEVMMSWKTPTVIEVALGAEINSYACADL